MLDKLATQLAILHCLIPAEPYIGISYNSNQSEVIAVNNKANKLLSDIKLSEI